MTDQPLISPQTIEKLRVQVSWSWREIDRDTELHGEAKAQQPFYTGILPAFRFQPGLYGKPIEGMSQRLRCDSVTHAVPDRTDWREVKDKETKNWDALVNWTVSLRYLKN